MLVARQVMKKSCVGCFKQILIKLCALPEHGDRGTIFFYEDLKGASPVWRREEEEESHNKLLLIYHLSRFIKYRFSYSSNVICLLR